MPLFSFIDRLKNSVPMSINKTSFSVFSNLFILPGIKKIKYLFQKKVPVPVNFFFDRNRNIFHIFRFVLSRILFSVHKPEHSFQKNCRVGRTSGNIKIRFENFFHSAERFPGIPVKSAGDSTGSAGNDPDRMRSRIISFFKCKKHIF